MAEGKHEIKFEPNPMQKAFIESRAKADLFSSRMGEGKSAALAWSVFYHTRHNPGARWVVIRDIWDNLEGTTMQEFFKWFPPGVCGDYQATRKRFIWREGIATGQVYFMGLDDAADATKLQSRELAGFAIDEPAPATESGGVSEMVFDIAMSRLRQPDMKWYSVKLAENNPDEVHWTHQRFVDPGTDGFVVWQPPKPENISNLPPEYYEDLNKIFARRPDLQRRFVEGQFGFQQIGKAVTPEWNDNVHGAVGLYALPRIPLHLLWDFGHNPTCLITQITPLGHWNIIESYVGEGIGVEELIETAIKPRLEDAYKGFKWRHIGDPAGKQREQTSIKRSAVKFIRQSLGGHWTSGPVRMAERINPLRAVMRQMVGGAGLIQVDRHKAKEVWHALRGSWHYHVARTGVISGEAVKDLASHPGDALSYGAAVLYPPGKLLKPKVGIVKPRTAGFFGGSATPSQGLGFEKPGLILPKEARIR